MARTDATAGGGRRQGRLGSAAVLLVVLGVALAAVLAGGGSAADPVASVPTETDVETPAPTVRSTPTFQGLEASPELRPAALDGRLVAAFGRGCRAAVLELATLRWTPAPGLGCPLAVAPAGGFVAVRAGREAWAARPTPDARRGPSVRIATGERLPPAVAVDDDGTVASCVEGAVTTRSPAGAARTAPGCEPVALRDGLHWLDDPEGQGLPLVRGDGRRLRLRSPALRETSGPYRVTSSTDGGHLAALAFHPGLSRHLVVVRVADGHIVVRRTVDPVLDAIDVRVAPGGRAAAVLVATDEAPTGRAWFLLRGDRRAPLVRSVGGAHVGDVAFSPDGRRAVVLTQEDGDVVVVRTDTFGPEARVPLPARQERARGVAWLP